MRTVPIIILISVAAFTLTAVASPRQLSQKQHKLKQVSQKIQSLQQQQGHAKNRRQALFNELKNTELGIARLATRLNLLNNQLKQQSNAVSVLEAKINHQQNKLNQQRQLLAQQARAAYYMGDESFLKLLLNQEDPARLSRYMSYFSYLNQSRLKLINNINTSVSELERNQSELAGKTLALREIQHQQLSKKQQLEKKQTYRQGVIAELNQQIQTRTQKLQNLIANKVALENVISQIKSQSFFLDFKKPFKKMRGQLPWPLVGKIINIFNQPIQNSTIKQNGIIIRAPEGTAVRSIYPGKVVFSNWLRGFGLLMIVKHTQGFMSLYAHNSALYKKVGDNVLAGTLIAKVGNSGGNKQPGLYFEIRQQGKPINPMRWCSNKTKFQA